MLKQGPKIDDDFSDQIFFLLRRFFFQVAYNGLLRFLEAWCFGADDEFGAFHIIKQLLVVWRRQDGIVFTVVLRLHDDIHLIKVQFGILLIF